MKLRIAYIGMVLCAIVLSACARASSTVNPVIYVQTTLTAVAPATLSTTPEPGTTTPSATATSSAAFTTPEPTPKFLADISQADRLLKSSDVASSAPDFSIDGANLDGVEKLGVSSDTKVSAMTASTYIRAAPAASFTSFCFDLGSETESEKAGSNLLNDVFPNRRDFPLLTGSADGLLQWTFRKNDGPYFYVYNYGHLVCGIEFFPHEDDPEYTTLALLSKLGKQQIEKSSQ